MVFNKWLFFHYNFFLLIRLLNINRFYRLLLNTSHHFLSSGLIKAHHSFLTFCICAQPFCCCLISSWKHFDGCLVMLDMLIILIMLIMFDNLLLFNSIMHMHGLFGSFNNLLVLLFNSQVLFLLIWFNDANISRNMSSLLFILLLLLRLVLLLILPSLIKLLIDLLTFLIFVFFNQSIQIKVQVVVASLLIL